MRTRIVIAVALLASVAIGLWLPEASAQEVFISPVNEPAPPVPTPEVAPTDQSGMMGDGLVTNQPGDGHNDDDSDCPAPAIAPARWVYAGGPLGWVPVYDYNERNER
jgi:hypothetical protein